MPVLFQSRPGLVVRLDDPAEQCKIQVFNLEPAITYADDVSIITRVTLHESVNIQFAHMLGSRVFVYVFGDKIGQVQLSGLCFSCSCDDPNSGLNGPEQMLLWYYEHRSSRRRSPVRVSIGNQVLEGFVVDFTEDVIDPSLNLFQWSINLATIPEDLTGGDDVVVTIDGGAGGDFDDFGPPSDGRGGGSGGDFGDQPPGGGTGGSLGPVAVNGQVGGGAGGFSPIGIFPFPGGGPPQNEGQMPTVDGQGFQRLPPPNIPTQFLPLFPP